MNAPSSLEKKLVMPPKAFVELLFKLKGGSFIDAEDADIAALLEEMEFPTGEEGKAPKKEAAENGYVFVNRSVVATTKQTGDACRILLLHRGESHAVTTGGSILTSGDPRMEAAAILSKKVSVEQAGDAPSFEKMGVALSDPAKTKGIHYLFDIHRARIADDAKIMTQVDHGTLIGLNEAMQAIQDKPTELAVLERIRRSVV